MALEIIYYSQHNNLISDIKFFLTKLLLKRNICCNKKGNLFDLLKVILPHGLLTKLSASYSLYTFSAILQTSDHIIC